MNEEDDFYDNWAIEVARGILPPLAKITVTKEELDEACKRVESERDRQREIDRTS
jgi:hypothetical protein